MSLIHDDMTFDEPADEHTVVEGKPHWSTLKRKFIAAFSAITVIKPPSREERLAAKMTAEELLAIRESQPELTNARWTAKLDVARMRAEQIEHDAEMSMFKHWKLAVREQEMQEESEPLPSVSIAAPYVIGHPREAQRFYSYAEEQAAKMLSTMPVHRIAPSPLSMLSPRRIAVAGAIAGVMIAIGIIAASGGSTAAMASASMAAPVSMNTVTAPALTAQPIADGATRLPPVEHRFDQPSAPTVPTVSPIVAPIIEEMESAPVAEEAPAPVRKKHKRIGKSSRAKKVSVAERAPKSVKSSKRRPVVVDTSTALGGLRPSRR